MTPPDSGDMHECRCGYHIVGRDADGLHTWSKCKPDSGEREMLEQARQRVAVAEDQYANLPCPHGRPTWRMCPHCLGLNAPISAATTPVLNDPVVVLPLPLAQRILAALEQGYGYDRLRALAAELRERMPSTDQRKGTK